MKPAENYKLESAVDHLLKMWAQWHAAENYTKGYPARSAGFSTGGASQSFDEMFDANQLRILAVTDSVIDDLPRADRVAIYCEYLGRVWPWDDPLADSLALALEAFTLKACRKDLL